MLFWANIAQAAIETVRPRVRGDCADGPRPCPWLYCKHHLSCDINPHSGALMIYGVGSFMGELTSDNEKATLDRLEVRPTCALDIADSGEEMGPSELGEFYETTMGTYQQLVSRALVEVGPALSELLGIPVRVPYRAGDTIRCKICRSDFVGGKVKPKHCSDICRRRARNDRQRKHNEEKNGRLEPRDW